MRKSMIIVLGIFLVAAVSAVYAANPNEDAAAQTTEASGAKNMTYGQCVSENAVIKNACYATVKSTLSACKDQAAQNPDTERADIRKCKQDYKKDKKDCKLDFKASKKECAKIKHNFFETLGSAFK